MIEPINSNFSINPLDSNSESVNESMKSFSSLFKNSLNEVNNFCLLYTSDAADE